MAFPYSLRNGAANLQTRYINDFSKALASEVRILLQEVGKLRDERRQLQQYVLRLVLWICLNGWRQ